MRKLLILLCFLVGAAAAQTPPMNGETGKFTYSGVVNTPDISQAELYKRAKSWAADNYPDSKSIVLDDKEKLVCKGNFPITLFGYKHKIDNSLTLEFKEGRYKYTWTNFYITGQSVDHWELERKDLAMKKSIYSQVDEKIKGFLESIKEELTAEESKKEDW